MDLCLHAITHGTIDQLMSLDKTLSLKLWTHNSREKMLAIALYFNVRTGYALFDIALDLLWGW
jgi:hypothetical protein